MWNFLFPLTDLFITSPIEYIGDKRFDLKNKGYSSESNERKYISDKRNFETLQIVKNIINKAIYYKC